MIILKLWSSFHAYLSLRNIIKLEAEIAKIRVEIDNEKQDLYRLSNQIVTNCQQLADGKKQYVKWCEFQDWFKLDTDN